MGMVHGYPGTGDGHRVDGKPLDIVQWLATSPGRIAVFHPSMAVLGTLGMPQGRFDNGLTQAHGSRVNGRASAHKDSPAQP